MSAAPPVARRLERGTRLVAATHNPGKVRELRELLAPYGLDVVSAGELGLAEPEETGATFRANAELKALAAARAAGLPALADDSGLEVEALDGAPGVYAARWAGPAKDFGRAMQRVADAVRERGGWTETVATAESVEPPGPRANFTAALSLAWPDGTVETFEGKVFGHLIWPPRGTKGFGYDPMFVADGETLTFGEMEPARKHAISHRARAFALFSRACLS
jgi:XTP/dITP diphosphohydrolase